MSDTCEVPVAAIPVKKRIVWLDFLRIVAILCVIAGHMGPPEGSYPTTHCFLAIVGLPVCFFFFASGLFLKEDTCILVRRAAIIYAAYVLWTVITYFVGPLDRYLAAVITGQPYKIASYSISALFCHIEPGISSLRYGGHIWFLRELALLTLFTPLFLKLSIRQLAVLILVLNGWQFVSLSNWEFVVENNPGLPFILQRGAGAAGTEFYLAGVLVYRMGGIKALTKLSSLPTAVLLLVPCVMVLQFVLTVPDIISTVLKNDGVDLPLRTLALLSIGLLGNKLAETPNAAGVLVKRGMTWVAAFAPGVFFVYAAHFIYPLVTACVNVTKDVLPVVPYRILATCLPLFTFMICYLAYVPLRHIPYVSRILCFAPPKRK